MNILGLIPARGGSKAIPRKNIALLNGKPLLAYSCEAALASKRLTRVILNTDDPEIAEVGRQYGVQSPFLRPADLAGDDTPVLPVIQHSLAWLSAQESYHVDVLVLLQPTSPLREAEHIDEAVDLLLQTGADTVVSVVAVPHQYSPASLMQLNEHGQLRPYLDGPMVLRRQEKPRVYARNGPAVVAVRAEVIAKDRIYGEIIYPLEMGRVASIDIDDLEDLALAEYWINKRL